LGLYIGPKLQSCGVVIKKNTSNNTWCGFSCNRFAFWRRPRIIWRVNVWHCIVGRHHSTRLWIFGDVFTVGRDLNFSHECCELVMYLNFCCELWLWMLWTSDAVNFGCEMLWTYMWWCIWTNVPFKFYGLNLLPLWTGMWWINERGMNLWRILIWVWWLCFYFVAFYT